MGLGSRGRKSWDVCCSHLGPVAWKWSHLSNQEAPLPALTPLGCVLAKRGGPPEAPEVGLGLCTSFEHP